MRRLRAWLLRFGGIFRKRRRDAELAAELESHLQLHIEDNLRAGMAPEEARRRAFIQLGGVEQTKEIYRDRRGVPWLETTWQDFRFGARMLRKNPGFTAVAIITLALGIGVNSTVYSLVDAMLVRKPPVTGPDRVMMLLSRNPAPTWAANRSPVSPLDFKDWQAASTSFEGIAAEALSRVTLGGGAEPERVPRAEVSSTYFDVMGLTPMLGRTFLPVEETSGNAKTVILSEGLWKGHFGSDPRIIGETARINGQDYTVVGVMPNRFQLLSFPAQLWTPLTFTAEQLSPSGRTSRFLFVFGRLKPGIDEGRARAELAAIADHVAKDHPDTEKGWGGNVMSLQEYDVADANSGPALAILMATVGFVLLIACANLANLTLARNSSRQVEFAIRTSLGAGRIRLMRQLLTECMLLSLGGGAVGLVFAMVGVWVVRGALNWNEYTTMLASSISVNGNVLIYTLILSMVTAIVFGLAPALRFSRSNLQASMKQSSRTTSAGRERHRLQKILVTGELALSLVLLAGAGLFVKSFVEEMQSSMGVNPSHVLTARVSLAGLEYLDPPRQAAFFQKVLSELDGAPQSQSTAVSSDLPLSYGEYEHFAVEGHPEPDAQKWPAAAHYSISPGYFATFQMPLLAGREFLPSDNANSAPVAIVNQAFVQRYLSNGDPLGSHIMIRSSPSPKWSEIVGVVGDALEYPGESPHPPQIYEPFLARPASSMCIVVRTRSEPIAFADSLRQAVWGVDKDQAVTNLKTMERVRDDSDQGDGFMSAMMGSFGGFALLLAAIGIYGVLAYLVGMRTHEIGIRIALGAQRSSVVGLIIRETMTFVLIGVAIGFAVSLTLPRLLKSVFESFQVRSASVLTGTLLLVILVGLISCYLPARRASRVDPIAALRAE